MDIKGHILLLCVRNIKKVSSDGSIARIGTEVQHHHSQNCEDDAHWLTTGTVTNGKAWNIFAIKKIFKNHLVGVIRREVTFSSN